MSKAEQQREELAVVADFLKEMSGLIPKLVQGVLQGLFSEEAGSNVGKAVGNFYKELKQAGMPEQTAVEMTRDYLGTLTKWSEALKGLRVGEFHGVPRGGEIGRRVREEAEKHSEKTPSGET
ncbi:MAG: hypothetical protein QW587_04320 [Candidatus Bathyarchaeia archaeon]